MGVSNLFCLFPGEKTAFDDDKPVLLPVDEYEFALTSSWKGYLWGRCPKLILTFRIVTEGPYCGKLLLRCYNIKGLTKRGEIIPKGWHSDFVREYSRLFGTPLGLRNISVRKYKNRILKGRVRVVERDSKQRPLPDGMKYSVIDELTGVAVG